MKSVYFIAILTLFSRSVNAQDFEEKNFKNAISIGAGFELGTKDGFMDFKYQRFYDKWNFGARIYRHSFEDFGDLRSTILSDTSILYRSQRFNHNRSTLQLEVGYAILNNVTIGAGIILGANQVRNTITNAVYLEDTLNYTSIYNEQLTLDYEYEVISPGPYYPNRHLAAEMTQFVYGLGVTFEFVTPITQRFDLVFRYTPELTFYSTIDNQAIYFRDDNYTSSLETTARFKHFASFNARLKL